MSVSSLSDIFKIGTNVLGSEIADNGNLILITGDVINKDVGEDDTEMWGPFGFASRPSKAIQGQSSAEIITITQGDKDIAIAGRDIRAQPIYGNLGDGESVMFATGPDGLGQARVACKSNGAITMYTTDSNTSDGNGIYFQVAPNQFKWVAPWGTMWFDITGLHCVTKSGARFDMGGQAGPPGLSSYAKISAGTFTANTPVVCLGPDALNGGLGYMPAAYGLLPGPKFTPILGAGVGAVVNAASASTCVLIAP